MHLKRKTNTEVRYPSYIQLKRPEQKKQFSDEGKENEQS